MTTKHRIFTTSFASVYPCYVAKAEKKGRKKTEVDAIICWLTGYSHKGLEAQLKKQKDLETVCREAPRMNPQRALIKGVVCPRLTAFRYKRGERREPRLWHRLLLLS